MVFSEKGFMVESNVFTELSDSGFAGSDVTAFGGDPPNEKPSLEASSLAGFEAIEPNEKLALGGSDDAVLPNLKLLASFVELSLAPNTKLGLEEPKVNPVVAGFFSPMEKPDRGFVGSLGAFPVPN